jgi:hypothetical protein
MDLSDVKSVFRYGENGNLVEAAAASDDGAGFWFMNVRPKAPGQY